MILTQRPTRWPTCANTLVSSNAVGFWPMASRWRTRSFGAPAPSLPWRRPEIRANVGCRTRRSIICCRWYLRKLPWRRTGAGHLIEFVTTTSRTRSRLARGMASHQHATERNPAGNRPRAGLSRRCWPSWASPSQRPASRTYGRDGRMSPTSIVVRRSAAFLPKTARPNIEPAPKRGSCAMRPNRQSFIACARRRWSV